MCIQLIFPPILFLVPNFLYYLRQQSNMSATIAAISTSQCFDLYYFSYFPCSLRTLICVSQFSLLLAPTDAQIHNYCRHFYGAALSSANAEALAVALASSSISVAQLQVRTIVCICTMWGAFFFLDRGLLSRPLLSLSTCFKCVYLCIHTRHAFPPPHKRSALAILSRLPSFNMLVCMYAWMAHSFFLIFILIRGLLSWFHICHPASEVCMLVCCTKSSLKSSGCRTHAPEISGCRPSSLISDTDRRCTFVWS